MMGRESKRKRELRERRAAAGLPVIPPPARSGAAIDLFGLGGQTQYLVAIPRSSINPDHPFNKATPAGSVGTYRVVFFLQRPGYALYKENQYAFETSGVKGDSHLAIRPPALTGEIGDQILIDAETDEGEFRFTASPNDEGCIGNIVTVITANSYLDAERRAYRALAPTLSHWATYFDTPVVIARIEMKEMQYGSMQMKIVTGHDIRPYYLPVSDKPLSVELRAFESYYREGVNSNSPTYQYLCFFKILEGVRANRLRAARARKKAGLPDLIHAPTLAERVPSQPGEYVAWLNSLFHSQPRRWDSMSIDAIFITEAVGRTIEELTMEPPARGDNAGPIRQLRNDIAHSLWESGQPTLVADEDLHIVRVNRWLPITKCIARLLLINDFGDQLGIEPAQSIGETPTETTKNDETSL
jgi:hypothetical protein